MTFIEENRKKERIREIKIGIFFVIALVILALFIFIVGDISHVFQRKGYPLYAYFDSVAGLEKRTVVRMAGVKVGYLRDIRLKGNQAEVLLNIYPEVEIPKDSKAILSALGLLGEKYVEILPGEGPGLAQPGEAIEGVSSAGFDQVGTMLLEIGDEVKSVGQVLRNFIGEGESETNIKETIQSLSLFVTELNDFFRMNKQSLNQSIQKSSQAIQRFDQSIEEISQNLDELILLLKETVEENRRDIKDNLGSMKELIGKTEESLSSLKDSLERIQKEEGTLGKLIYKDELYNKAEEMVSEVDRTIRPLSSLRFKLGLRTDYFSQSDLVKSTLSLGLWSAPGKYVLAQIIHNPWEDHFTYSLQGGVRWKSVSARAGIMESKFGAGIDIYILRDRLSFSFEGYDLNRHPRPHFRFWTRYAAFKHISFLVGIEDFTLSPNREVFFGMSLNL